MKFRVIAFFLAIGGARAESVRVLTYGSLAGKGSLGEFIEREFPKFCAGCSAKIMTTGETAGLIGRLRADKRRGRAAAYDVVLGLGSAQYREGVAEKLIGTGEVFDRSPFAIIVDTRRFPKKNWPTDWDQVPDRLKGHLLLQDPRTSGVAMGWLRAIFEMKAIDLPSAHQLVETSFPTWSDSYGAFTSGRGWAVWSYLTSEAYHRCNEKTDRYLALPLKGGYPVQAEYAAPVGADGPSAMSQKFLQFVVSQRVQKKLPLLNWMLPARASVRLPKCYAALTKIKTWDADENWTVKNARDWNDEWSR